MSHTTKYHDCPECKQRHAYGGGVSCNGFRCGVEAKTLPYTISTSFPWPDADDTQHACSPAHAAEVLASEVESKDATVSVEADGPSWTALLAHLRGAT